MPSAPLLIDLPGVARLAGVRRAVPSMWRARFRNGSDPFPPANIEKDGRLYFDAFLIAHWLKRTSHGNNPTPVADTAVSAAPPGFDLSDAAHASTADALLTLSAVTGEILAERDHGELRALAAAIDPEDRCLAAEVARADPAWAEWCELLADAAYSPLEASRILERRHAATRASAGSAGPLTDDAEELLLTVVEALNAQRPAVVALGAGLSPSLALKLLSTADEPDVDLSDHVSSRAIRRRMLLHGLPLPTPVSANVGATLTVLRIPSGPVQAPVEILRTVEEVALGMRDDDRAVVLGPATTLTGPITAADDLIRTDALRTGRVRAIARLPRGLVTSAVREPLALWVLGRATGDVPIPDRFTAVADLTDQQLTAAARHDLAADIMASMGGAHDVRAHAFRFARLVRTSSLLASRAGLMPRARPVRAGRSAHRDLPALLDQTRAAMVDIVPAAAPAAPSPPGPAAAAIESLAEDGHLHTLPGTRVASNEFSTAGLVTICADDLDSPDSIGDRRVDHIEFAQRHPSARLTMPGDVVFRTSPSPRAWVDREGSAVVVHPARILRISPSNAGGLTPELIALDIERSPGGPGTWRRWVLRRVAPSAAGSLDDALARIADMRRELSRRIVALDAYADLLSTGVASGAVTVTDPTDN